MNCGDMKIMKIGEPKRARTMITTSSTLAQMGSGRRWIALTFYLIGKSQTVQRLGKSQTAFNWTFMLKPKCNTPWDGAGSRQYCRYTTSPWVVTPLKEIWESPRTKENLVPVGFEPTTSGLDLPLYRLSYEASTGASRGNIGSEFAVSIQML